MMSKKLLRVGIISLLLRLYFAFAVYHPDVRNHIDWGKRFFDYGARHYYLANVWNFTWPNQPPGTIYMFAGMYKVYKFIFSILWWINIKIALFPSIIMSIFSEVGYPATAQFPAIAADFGIAILLYKFLETKSKKLAATASIIFLLNPAIWYNSAVWGQYDSVLSFFSAFVLISIT